MVSTARRAWSGCPPNGRSPSKPGASPACAPRHAAPADRSTPIQPTHHPGDTLMTTALPPQATAFHRMQQLMSTSPVPSISTELLTTADGELNRELNAFLFDPPSDPTLLKGKRIAICCTNGVEEVEIL